MKTAIIIICSIVGGWALTDIQNSRWARSNPLLAVLSCIAIVFVAVAACGFFTGASA